MPMKNFKVKAHVRVNPRTRVSETVQAESKTQIRKAMAKNRPKLVIDSITLMK